MLKWTSESEYFLSFENFFADTIYHTVQEQSLYPFRCACAARGNKIQVVVPRILTAKTRKAASSHQ